MTRTLYGYMPDGRAVEAYALDNGRLKIQALTYGATLDKLWAPDRGGGLANVLRGFGSLEERMARSHYEGEVVGRYANRIAGAKFTLGGREYRVTANKDGITCLHGAGEFSHAVWRAEPVGTHAIALHYTSPAGSHGFPGALETCVRYTLNGGSLLIEYRAVSDADTVVNLTNHAYFNLAGQGKIFDHVLRMGAAHYLPLNRNMTPTGEQRAVAGTEFDFRQARPIGREYDVNFCNPGMIEVYEPMTDRSMTVETDQPGVQLFTGQCLAEPCTGFCLETQTWPDGPNQPWAAQCLLRAGEEFKSFTRFTFDTK